MSVNVRQKKGHLYLDIYYKGQRHWESLQLRVPKDPALKKEVFRTAENVRCKREQQLVMNRYQLLDPIKANQTLASYVESIAKDYSAVSHIVKMLNHLKKFNSEIRLLDVDVTFIEGFKSFLVTQEHLGANTCRHYIKALKAVLRRAVVDRLINENPAELVKTIRVPDPDMPYLTIEEIQKLFDTSISGASLAQECKPAFILSCFTGLRLGDLRTLTWGDIKPGDEPEISKQINKTGHRLTLPLVPKALELLGEVALHHKDELIFPALAKTKSEYRPLDRWRKAAGIEKKFGWNAARHSFAMMALSVSSDIYSVSKLLGHSSITITTRYLHFASQRARTIFHELPTLNDEKNSKAAEDK